MYILFRFFIYLEPTHIVLERKIHFKLSALCLLLLSLS